MTATDDPAATDYEALYRRAFALLGRPLTPADATPPSEIVDAEARLDRQAPRALKAFYAVAGRARDFMNAQDHLLPPERWRAEDGDRLRFMVENQAVVVWAVAAGDDPPVCQATNAAADGPLAWEEVCPRTSAFLRTMLCWQGAAGEAMPCGDQAPAPPGLPALTALAAGDWEAVGEVNGMRGYLRPGVALCHLPWDGGAWRVFAGAATPAALRDVRAGLALDWEEGDDEGEDGD